MSCRSTKCENYEDMKYFRDIEDMAADPCIICKRWYPDQFVRKKEK